jgi:hypothetical protein
MAQVQITPDSVITLYDNVECMDGEQVIFTSREAQTAYFSNRAVGTFTGCTYVRQTGRVRVPMRLNATAFSANYIGYINPSMENVRVYGRIIDTEYTNNETTEIQFEIDWLQTFMFSANYNSTTIEREMLSQTDYTKAMANPWDRSILELNTEEGIAINDYDRVRSQAVLSLAGDNAHAYICVLLAAVKVAASEDLSNVLSIYREHDAYEANVDAFRVKAGNVNGIATPAGLYCARGDIEYPATSFKDNQLAANYSGNIPLYQALIDVLTYNKVSSAIISIFQLTSEDCSLMFAGNDTVSLSPVKNAISEPKAQRYPFACARLLTADGTDKVLKYENFSGDKTLRMGIDAYHDSEKWIAPVGYCGVGTNYAERLSYAGIPQLPYVTDAYLEYAGGIYQQAKSRALDPMRPISTAANTAGGLAEVGANMTMGNVAGAVSAGVKTGAQSVGAALQSASDYLTITGDNPINALSYMSRRVENAGGTYHAGQSRAIGYPEYKDKFRVEYDTLTEAAQARIAAFFNAYGYTSGRLGKPRVTAYMGRTSEAQPHWVTIDGVPSTYCKTSTLRVYGVNKPACEYIAAIFNTGCRFIQGDGR